MRFLETVGEKSFDEQTPGNEFRSLICVCDMVALHLVAELKCSKTRSSLLFQSTAVCKKLENYSAILRFFALSFQQIVLLTETLDENSLFPSLDCEYSLYRRMLKGIESLDASCFYGRTFGFQFAPSVTSTFSVIEINSATYSLSWESGTAACSSLLNFVRYFLNPEEGARRIMKVKREADLEFCRDFCNLSEIPPPKLFCPTMEINKVVLILMDGPIRLDGKDGRSIEIPERVLMDYQLRYKCVSCRQQLVKNCRPKNQRSHFPPIYCFIVTAEAGKAQHRQNRTKHIYGCGQNVLYAYAWILKNPEKFGWDGKKRSMVGDSAGGNLIVSVALHLAQLKAARMPDGPITICTPFLFQCLPSSLRVLSFTDPLLQMEIVFL
ncbi:Hormone-sensitive lipase [Aphelenchoides besseyi]|nr:Hormone-sensitive lipase [Aphelenchoides besseyi]